MYTGVSTFGCIGLFFIIISALPNRDIPLPVVSIPILLIRKFDYCKISTQEIWFFKSISNSCQTVCLVFDLHILQRTQERTLWKKNIIKIQVQVADTGGIRHRLWK